MEKFLKDIFGIEAVCQKFYDFAGISHLLVDAYDYILVEINEVKFLAIAPVYEQPTIPTLVNHMKKISSAKNLLVVYHPRSLKYSKMKGLLQQKVPFIVDGRQAYLPFLGTFLQAVSDVKNENVRFSLPAQLLATMYLYSRETFLYIKKAVEFLPYSAMSMTRAMREMEASELFYVEKDKQNNVLRSQFAKRELFEELKARFNSPIWKRGYIDNECVANEMVLAGEDALAEKSMLANTLPAKYAVYKKIVDIGVLNSELLDSKKQSELQLWSYDPLLFSQLDIPDPISLVVSLKDVHDERVEQALDGIMEEVWEGQHGTWIKKF
ncbi:hypothetical protein [uncultured Phascolarctobacterium sp.]|uniref:hypothetical protein n=1 Tax=uncultured Phascolarctobacterium sp. TaxID=512296 RepID=UPI0025DF1954|nr:hypothetical protein [uncultured Phascolarctobacterium sp.]